jgi:DnaJ-class molecular chaperone
VSKLKPIDCPTCEGHGVVEGGTCTECKGLTYVYIEDEPKPKRKLKIGNDHYERLK